MAAALWLMLFRAAGKLRRAPLYRQPTGGQRVIVVAPHPDDEVLGCGGALARHIEAGDEVCVVIVTDGRRSRAGGLHPDEMARTRRREATAAARALGVVDLRLLGLHEGDWHDEALISGLATAIADSAPDIVYAPCWLDYHPEHRRVAAVLARLIPDTCTARIYTLHVPLNLLVNLRIDVSSEMPLVARLFDIYATQRGSLMRGLRLRRYAAALSGGGTATEEFCAVPATAYRHAHDADMAEPEVRGMRARAFLDPLCYAVGRRSRRALAARFADA